MGVDQIRYAWGDHWLFQPPKQICLSPHGNSHTHVGGFLQIGSLVDATERKQFCLKQPCIPDTWGLINIPFRALSFDLVTSHVGNVVLSVVHTVTPCQGPFDQPQHSLSSDALRRSNHSAPVNAQLMASQGTRRCQRWKCL